MTDTGKREELKPSLSQEPKRRHAWRWPIISSLVTLVSFYLMQAVGNSVPGGNVVVEMLKDWNATYVKAVQPLDPFEVAKMLGGYTVDGYYVSADVAARLKEQIGLLDIRIFELRNCATRISPYCYLDVSAAENASREMWDLGLRKTALEIELNNLDEGVGAERNQCHNAMRPVCAIYYTAKAVVAKGPLTIVIAVIGLIFGLFGAAALLKNVFKSEWFPWFVVLTPWFAAGFYALLIWIMQLGTILFGKVLDTAELASSIAAMPFLGGGIMAVFVRHAEHKVTEVIVEKI